MKVTPLPDVEPGDRRGRRVAVGTFDGVHIGHREVIRDTDTVLTFDPHPLTVLAPADTPKLVMPFEIKRDAIAELGVSELVVVPFDEAFSKIEAEEFVRRFLIERLGAAHVSVGENFRFGRRARGTPELLASFEDFETRTVGLVGTGGQTVSSSAIRDRVAAGDVSGAADLLGRPFALEGEVVHGDKRGRELGMPTANIRPDPRFVVPAHGVYAAWAGGRPAAVNVGVRPTFGEDLATLVEAHLLDFDGDLYGQTLRVTFLERLRDERRFDSVAELVEQMRADVRVTREVCARARA